MQIKKCMQRGREKWEKLIVKKKTEGHFFLRAPAEEFALLCLLNQDDARNLQMKCLEKKNHSTVDVIFLFSKLWLVFQLVE